MKRPLFSILIPSRSRLELLRKAVDSAIRQDADFEIVIADNASDQPYAPYVAGLGPVAANSVRSEQSLTVTENWNRALDAATGQYIIMLGDDDALAPGWLAKATAIIAAHEQPDVLYTMAFHYAYPGVVPSKPRGYLATVNNSELFRDRDSPYRLDRAAAIKLGQRALKFRHRFSFNAQHFVWKRDFIASLSNVGPFFQSPYPDYYAAIVTMLEAQSIIVVPSAEVIVGISPKSFGFYYNNREFDGGEKMLGNAGGENAWISELSPDARAAIALPGSAHTRSWLLSALLVARNVDAGTSVDLRRYRRLQFLELLAAPADEGSFASQIRRLRPYLQPSEEKFLNRIAWFLRVSKALPVNPATVRQLFAGMGAIYTQATVTDHEIGNHQSISDAWEWLAQQLEPRVAAKPSVPAIEQKSAFAHEMEQMAGHMLEIDAPLYHPSKLWADIGTVNARQLQQYGPENFKRTVNLHYSTHIPASASDHQFANLARFWADGPSIDVLGIRLDEAQVSAPTPLATPDGRALYGLFVGLLWNYTRSAHRNGLTDVLAEPILGNPLRCALGGRMISQDVANSIRERNLTLSAFEADLGRGSTVSIVEIGAGYGRLGYVLLSSAPCRYTVVDVAPALALSQWYLTALFPAKRAFRFRPWKTFEEVETELATSDLCFLTPDQFALLPAKFFDIGVTVNSLCEMTRAQVDSYLSGLSRVVDRAIFTKERIEHTNTSDGVTLRRSDYTLPAPWRLTADRVDAVQDEFFEHLWLSS